LFSKISYYFCIQEVEEETGTAEEQPVSNRLPALRSNIFLEGILLLKSFPSFSLVTDIAGWLKKPNRKSVLHRLFYSKIYKKLSKQPSISRWTGYLWNNQSATYSYFSSNRWSAAH